MLSPAKLHSTALVLALALAATCAVPAFAAMPQPMHSGNITYITGGIGLSERQALEAQAHSYNLAITNANEAGDFTTDTALMIQSKDGRAVLSVPATGPLFMAKLPTGDYVIHATNDGQNRMRDVRILASQATNVHLIWPQKG